MGSSTFVFAIKIKKTDGKTISFGLSNNPDYDISIKGSINVTLDPKELGQSSSTEKLADLIENGIKVNQNETFMWIGFRPFVNSVRAIGTMDNVMSIYISGEQFIPCYDDYYKLEAVYYKGTDEYLYKEDGKYFDEVFKGISGGQWHCKLKDAIESNTLNPEKTIQERVKNGNEKILPSKSGVLKISGVLYISANAYKNNLDIVSVEIDGDVETIGESAFEGCENLESLILHEGVSLISDKAFYKCKKLNEINIPSTVTYVGYRSFANCISAKKLVLNEGLKRIGSKAFSNCKSIEGEIKIPDSVVEFVETNYEALAFAGCKKIESFEFSRNIEVIPKLFDNCTKLKKVIIWDKVKEFVGLSYSQLKNLRVIYKGTLESFFNIDFSSSILSSGAHSLEIGDVVFERDGILKIPSGVSKLKHGIFSSCSFKEVIIPEGVEEINGAFLCADMEILYLPISLKYVSNNSFACCRNLTTIHYNGTIADWKNIQFESRWNDDSSPYTVYCTDGEIKVKK